MKLINVIQYFLHCTMRTLYSIFSSQPNEVGHDFTLHNCDIIQHIFFPTRSIARKRYCTMCALCNAVLLCGASAFYNETHNLRREKVHPPTPSLKCTICCGSILMLNQTRGFYYFCEILILEFWNQVF